MVITGIGKSKTDNIIYIIDEECTPQKKTDTFNDNKWLHVLLFIAISVLALTTLYFVFKDTHSMEIFVEKDLLREETRDKPKQTVESLIEFEITSYSTAYLFASARSFYNASSYCKYRGMKLYKINSNYKQNLIFNHTERMFSSGGGTRIWVNGKWSSDNQQWLSYPDNEVVLPSARSNISYKYGTDDRDCLAIQSFRRNMYEIASVSCSATNYFYCES